MIKGSSVVRAQNNGKSMLMRFVTGVPSWLVANKFKSLFIIVFIYVARKLWLLYLNYVKPALDFAKNLK